MSVLPNDCFLHDRDRLRHAETLQLIEERLVPVAGTCEIELADAVGRVLAADLVAPRDVPAFDNAAVDGFAYAFEAGLQECRVAGRTAAGDRPATIGPGEAVRIFTGAPMPLGADTVAMQEDCEVEGDRVRLPAIRAGSNRRRAGEDMAKGAPVLSAGTVIGPMELAAAGATGVPHLAVRERLNIAVLSTGDELLQPGDSYRQGAVYDSNRAMLTALVTAWGGSVRHSKVLPDDAASVRVALEEASDCDVIVSSGGASRGEEDHVLAALDALGTRHAWQLAVKPGRPLMMGQIGGCAFFGLPGNPVAAAVCALLYLRPALRRLGGAASCPPRAFRVPAAFSIRSKPDRREFLRARIVGSGEAARVEKFSSDGSGLSSGLVWADGLVEVAEETTSVDIGEPVDFLPFASFGLGG